MSLGSKKEMLKKIKALKHKNYGLKNTSRESLININTNSQSSLKHRKEFNNTVLNEQYINNLALKKSREMKLKMKSHLSTYN